MGFLRFMVGAGVINKLSKNKKSIDSFYKGTGKSIMFLSALTVEIVQLIAKGVILGYKGAKFLYRIILPVHLKREVLISVYGEQKTLTVVDSKRYKTIKAYDYYPNLLKATPKERAK